MNIKNGRGLIPHSEEATGIPFAVRAEAPIVYNWNNIIQKNSPPPGKNQNSSSSCPAQAGGYGFYIATKIDTNRNDPYSNYHLPEGGAYLVSPPQWFSAHGVLLLSDYPDPNPENEENMEAPISGMDDSKRIKTYRIDIMPVVQNPTIDEVAQAIMDYDVVNIGIKYTEGGFSKSWTYPTFDQNDTVEGHDICCLNPIIHNNLKAIDCMSSWYGMEGPDGISTHHVIDENFFNAGGVFEMVCYNISPLPQTYPTPANFPNWDTDAFSPEVKAAIEANANGGKNIIINGEIVPPYDPNFKYPVS